jgi:Tfp pilus assembly protein FimT
MKKGFSIIEIVAILALMGIILSMVVPKAAKGFDRLRVGNATAAVASFYGGARFGAILRGTPVRIEFGADSLRAFYEGGADSLFLFVDGPAHHGVNMIVSRNVIRIHPNGVGWGGANTKLVLWRGEAAESLTTSRLGRMKRWR